MRAGILIAIEGIDGAGKTTQAALLAESLRDRGLDVVSTREPTSGRYGQQIRTSSMRGEESKPHEELALFFADRREHVAQLIGPALRAGKIVITDRYYLSTAAYQGARGLDAQRILEESESTFPVPSLALLLLVPVHVGLQRVTARGHGTNPVFERADYLEQVSAVMAKLKRDYIVRVDGTCPVLQVRAAIADAIKMKLGL